MGGTGDVAEKGQGRVQSMKAAMTRQTDRHTSLCLYICAIPKILGILPQMSKHPSINEDLANASKQCIPINEFALLLTLLPDLFNILFFFPILNIYIYSLQPLESFARRKTKRLV